MKKDIIVYYAGKIIPAIANLLIIIFSIRYLGGQEYGKYTLILSFMMLVASFCYGWIQQGMLRFMSEYNFTLSLIEFRFFLKTFLSATLAGIIVFLSAIIYFDQSILNALVISMTSILYIFMLFRLTLYQIKFFSTRYALLESYYNLLMLIFCVGFLFLYQQNNFMILFNAMLLSLGLLHFPVFFSLIKIIKNKWKFIGKYWDNQFFRKVWDYSSIMTLWLFVSYLFNVADRFIINEIVGYEAVGVYSSVYDIFFKLASFACVPVLLAYHPRIVELWNKENKKEAIRFIKKGLQIEMLLLLFCLIGFLIFKNILFETVLSLNEPGLIKLSLPIIISSFFWQAAMFLHKPLELALKQKQMLIAITISLIVNIISNIILIPIMGYQVAAYTTLGSILIYAGIIIFTSKKITENILLHG